MAGPTKKSRKPAKAQDSDNESMSEESESGTYHGQQEIEATFEGRNPEGQDFHGIKQLLNQLFLKAHLDLSQMTDMLIAQNGIGSVLKQSFGDDDDDDDELDDDTDMSDENNVFGITSVLNLTSHKETPCIQQFFALLEEMSSKHADSATSDNIKRLLAESKIGLLINERFVNIPAKISSVMFSSLSDEIDRMTKKDQSYKFDYYVMICKTCRPKDNTESEEIFSNDEEAIITNEAEISFDFSVVNEADSGLGGRWLSEDKQMVPFRRVILFKADKFKNIVTQVTSFVQ